MATGDRLRYDGVEVYLAQQLESGANTIALTESLKHDGGREVDTIQSGEYLSLSILDSNYRLREIVHLTDYTQGATSGTIERAQEGTLRVTHPAGAKVVHSATVEDFLLVQDHADDPTAHQDLIESIASGLIDTAINAHVGDTDPITSVDDPHPYYVRKTTPVFLGDITFDSDTTVTIEGILRIAEGAQLIVDGDLIVNGRFFINGRQLWISNDPPPNPTPDIVWIQTYGQVV